MAVIAKVKWPLLLIGVGLCLWLSAPPPPAPSAATLPGRLPSDWAWLQRTFPHFQADADAYLDALSQAQALRAASKTDRFGRWQPAGPTNIGGRIVDVAFDPKRPEILYAAAATGGVFKSEDGGAVWRPLFDDQAVLTIGDLAVNPLHPETLYVGTGEANGGHNNVAGGGLYRSVDGGNSWTFQGLASTTSIGRVLVDPVETARVYVAAVGSYFAPNPERGVYRSLDHGATWEQVLFVSDSTGIIDLIMRPDDPSVLLAAAWQRVRRPERAVLSGAESGLYRSLDGGDTWEQLGPAHGLPDPEAHRDAQGHVRIGRIGLAVCRDVPAVMYALYTDGTTYLGLYRSDDGGTTWRDADPAKRILQGAGNFSWYFGQVRVHPEDPDRVYVMDVQFMQSHDGGATWAYQTGTHVDHHALAFHPSDPQVMVNGNDGGLALTADGGRTWTRARSLPVTQFYEVSIDPSNPERLYGGTQDNGTLRTLTGRPDAWDEIFGGDGFYVNVDPDDPNTLYVESQFGNLYKSADGGTTFAPAMDGIDRSEKRNWSTPVVMDPTNRHVLYYGTDRLYRTEDGAATWQPISGRLPKGQTDLLGTVTAIAVAPSDPDVLYAGTDDGNLWVSADYGRHWTDVTGDLPHRWITRIRVDPSDAQVAYVTFSGLKWKDPQPHVFRTADRGRTWTDISSNLPDAPVNALAIDPDGPQVLYLGSDVGAFVSLDAGLHWEALGHGLPAVPVYDLQLHPAGRYLVAGTHGRSMYRLELATPSSTAGADRPAPAFHLDPVFPNPFTDATRIRFRLAQPEAVRLEVYDLLGRRIRTLFDRPASAGEETVLWDGQDDAGRPVAAGTYVVRMTLGDAARGPHVQSVRLTRLR